MPRISRSPRRPGQTRASSSPQAVVRIGTPARSSPASASSAVPRASMSRTATRPGYAWWSWRASSATSATGMLPRAVRLPATGGPAGRTTRTAPAAVRRSTSAEVRTGKTAHTGSPHMATAVTAAASSRSAPGPAPAAISAWSKTPLLAWSAPVSLGMDMRGHVPRSGPSPRTTHAAAHDAHSPVHVPPPAGGRHGRLFSTPLAATRALPAFPSRHACPVPQRAA